jgi:hypothetical protein
MSTFYENRYDETNSLLPSVSFDSSIDMQIEPRSVTEVETTTFDEYAHSKNLLKVDFASIDVQNLTAIIVRNEFGLEPQWKRWQGKARECEEFHTLTGLEDFYADAVNHYSHVQFRQDHRALSG